MARPILFVIHGMGQQPKNWDKEIKDILNDSLKQFPAFEGLSPGTHDRFTDYAQVIPLSYDNFFEEQRSKWAKDAKSVIAHMAKQPDSHLESHLSEKEASSLLNLQAGLERNSFFNTHILDVLLYRFTNLGERIRVSVAKQMVKVLRDYEQDPTFGILAYALGTSVIHDTLHKLYSHKQWREGEVSKTFTPGHYQVGLLTMLANVSRVLQSSETNAKAYNSKVKPGANGVCKKMINVAHDFDPIAQTKPFMPGDQWLHGRQDVYQHLHLNSVIERNTHSLMNYLGNPLVYVPLIKYFSAEGSITKAQENKAFREFSKKTINADSEQFLQRLSELKISEPSSLQAVFDAWRNFSDRLK